MQSSRIGEICKTDQDPKHSPQAPPRLGGCQESIPSRSPIFNASWDREYVFSPFLEDYGLPSGFWVYMVSISATLYFDWPLRNQLTIVVWWMLCERVFLPLTPFTLNGKYKNFDNVQQTQYWDFYQHWVYGRIHTLLLIWSQMVLEF